jgi:hypothetical protein
MSAVVPLVAGDVLVGGGRSSGPKAFVSTRALGLGQNFTQLTENRGVILSLSKDQTHVRATERARFIEESIRLRAEKMCLILRQAQDDAPLILEMQGKEPVARRSTATGGIRVARAREGA